MPPQPRAGSPPGGRFESAPHTANGPSKQRDAGPRNANAPPMGGHGGPHGTCSAVTGPELRRSLCGGPVGVLGGKEPVRRIRRRFICRRIREWRRRRVALDTHRTLALLDNRTLFRHGTMSVSDTLRVSPGAAGYTTRVKTYPDGSMDIMVCDKPIFRASGWESSGSKRQFRDDLDEPPEGQSDTTGRALRRARAQVRELALANDFGLFVTLTLNGEMVDRYDMTAITKKLNVWLDNQVRRRGLAYVLVPERHKDGAIHFHGLFNNALEIVDSGHTDKAVTPFTICPGGRLVLPPQSGYTENGKRPSGM